MKLELIVSSVNLKYQGFLLVRLLTREIFKNRILLLTRYTQIQGNLNARDQPHAF